MTAKRADSPWHERAGSYAGTWGMLRLMLRRDRRRGPGWLLGLTLMLVYFANVLGTVLDDEALDSFAALAVSPAIALIGGPAYGFDEITAGRVVVGVYGVYLMIGAGLMSILTVSRHTRGEEQSSRGELVRAGPVGRSAPLAAALLLVCGMNLLLSMLMAAVFHFSALEPASAAGSVLFAASIGAAGLVFAAAAALTTQLFASARAASGAAGAVLAVSFVVRGLGDMSFVQDGALGWLSWFSPFGWSQQCAPLTLDRWWPLLLSMAAALLLIVTAFAVQSRRDLGAGILPERLGSSTATSWLSGPLALSLRLQRPALGWWSLALVAGGVVFGAFVQPMADNASGLPEEVLVVFGGTEGMVEGYLGFMGLYFAMMVAVFALLSVQSLRAEERSSRVEAVLATGVSRARWLLSWTLVTSAGSLWLLALAGLGVGVGAGLATGDWAMFADVLLGHVAHVPSVWMLLGLGVALYGITGSLIGLTWALFSASAALALFGEALELDDTVLTVSVFWHIGQLPAQELSETAIGALTVLAVLLIALGSSGFRRRDLVSD